MNEGIIFENKTQDLEKNGHPGIVLIPTDIDDEVTYCAYMTSNLLRYKECKEQYYVCEEGTKIKSYVNLGNLVRIQNNFRSTLAELNYEKCYEILKAICEYQTEYGECEVYEEIKDKIQVVLYLIEQSREHKGVEVDSQNVTMLARVPREYWDFLMYEKYSEKYSRKAEYESKLVRVYRLKEKLEDFIKHYDCKNTKKIEKIKRLYSDLKVFFGIGLEEIMIYAMAILRETQVKTIDCEVLKDIEQGLKDCIESDKEKQKAKAKKSEDKQEKKRNERVEAKRRKNQQQAREFINKYGRRLNIDEPEQGESIKPVGENR